MMKLYRLRLLVFLLCVLTSPLMYGQINTPAGAIIPFGTNKSYGKGIMPTNLPSGGAYGQATDAATAYTKWRENYAEQCTGTNPVQYRIRFDDPSLTVSEGIAYGMLLSAYAADKALFDGLWAYYKAHVNDNGVMNWEISGCSNNAPGVNGATDAELDAAMALLVADAQWPLETTPFDYTTEATTLINKIKTFEMDGATFQALNGDKWGGADCRNPSYQAPAYYKIFGTAVPADAAFWGTNAVNGAYSLIQANTKNYTTGLVSDWSDKAGTANNCQTGSSKQYGYDACRNPWRMATDVIWFNDANGAAQCNKIASYINTQGASNCGGPRQQDGSGSGGHYATFVSTFATGIMGASSTYQQLMNDMYTQTVGVSDFAQNARPSGYFGNTLRCISLFMMTGNFWKPGTSPNQEINVQYSNMNISAGGNLDLGNVQQGTSGTYTFTIQNLGQKALSVTTPVTVSGTDASKFSVTTQPGTSVNPNSSTTFVVKFTPGANVTGQFKADISITNNDSDENPYVIHLLVTSTQNATAPEIDVQYNGTSYAAGSSFSFGNVTQSAIGYKTFTIVNTGDAALTISSINVGPSGSGYSLYGPAPTSVPAGGSATFIVSVNAGSTAPATKNGTITISSNDGNEGSYVVNLTSSIVSCQTSIAGAKILQDYEANNNITLAYQPPASALFSPTATNPSMTGLNTSPIAASITRDPASTYVSLRYMPCGGTTTNNVVFDMTTPVISMLIYSPAAGIPIFLSPKNASEKVILADYSSDSKKVTTKANEWERIYFDLSNIKGNTTVKFLDIMIDPTPASGAPKRVYYIDEIKYDAIPCITDLPSSQVFIDYDGHMNLNFLYATTNGTSNGTLNEVYSNPSKTAPNTSANVAQYIRQSTGKYQGFRYAGCQNSIDLSAKSVISMLVYSGAANIPIQMSLATGSGASVQAVTVKTTKANAWEKLYFDFSASKGKTSITYLDVYPDTAAAFASNLTYYFDEIRYDDLPCPPAPTITASGATTFCEGGSVTLTANTTATGATYQWNNAAGVITGASSSTYKATAAGNYTVTVSGGGCSQTSNPTAVTVNSLPAAVAAITGKDKVCPSAQGEVYSVALASGATSYTWTVPTGVTIASGANTNAITVNFAASFTTGSITVAATNDCGSSTAASITVNKIATPVAGTIAGSATVCSQDQQVAYSIAPVTGATGYTWTVPTGATIAGGANTNSITVNYAAAGGKITVTPVTACGAGTASSLDVVVNTVPGAAGAVSGPASLCGGASNEVFSVAAVTGATSYTWSFPAGVTITSADTKSNSVTVTWGTTAGNVTVTPSNTCGNGTASAAKAVAVNGSANPAGPVSGSDKVCAGQTGVTYSIAAVDGADSYTWSVPSGATITAGATSNTITVTWGTTGGDVKVTPVSSCGNGAPSTVAVVVSTVPGAAGTVTGSQTICSGSTGNTFSIAAVNGASGYTWTVPTGATITGGANSTAITVTWGTTGGLVKVTPTNSCGAGTASQLQVAVNTVPGAAGTISGPASLCGGSSGQIFSIAAVTGATSYTWSFPAGVTITSTDTKSNSVTVTWGTTAGNVTVTPSNTCGNGTASAAKAVAVNGSANPAGPVSGSDKVCAGQTGVTYSIAAVDGADSYTWSVPSGATITAGATSNTITVTWGTTGGDVKVTPVSSCGNGAPSTVAVAVSTVPGAAGTVTGSQTICSGSTGNTFSIAAVNGATGYTWTVPTGATITGGANSTAITVTWGTTGGLVKVTPTNTCGAGTASQLQVAVNTVPGAAGTISGPASLCGGSSGQIFSIAAVTGATSYTWSFPAGVTITSEDTKSNSVTVTWGTTAGNVTVTPSNTCGNGTASAAKAVAVNGSANPAGPVSGSDKVCAGQTGVTYSIAAVDGADSYTWSVPSGATITAGATSNAITVSWGATGGGNIHVTPVSGCGNGAPSPDLAVTLNSKPGAAGQISGTGNVCSQKQGEVYSIAAVDRATGYTWVLPSGATIASGSNTNSIAVNFAGAGGTISVTPFNECGNGTASTMNVNVNTAPGAAGTISGSATACGGQADVAYSIAAVNGATGYTWTLPADATIATGDNTNSIKVNFGTTGGKISVAPSNACGTGSSSEITVTINGTANPAGPVTGKTTLCAGETGVVYSIVSVTGASGYTWTLPGGATIASGANSPAITLNFASNAVSGDITVTPTSTCGAGASSKISVTVNKIASAAGAITGVASFCVNETGVSYSIAEVSGATSYAWTVPAGAVVASGTGTNSITVNFAGTGGTISVTPESGCGNGTSSSKAVAVTSEAGNAGVISGPENVCSNSANNTFSITPVIGATEYQWTVPAGATIKSGANSNAITVTWGTEPGEVTVTPVSRCGNGLSSTLTIALSTSGCASHMIDGPVNVVAGGTYTYSVINPVNGATYKWSLPPGATVVSVGTNNTTITITYSYLSGDIQLTENNGGTVTTDSLTINVNPSAVISQLLSSSMSVNPNPSQGLFRVTLNEAFKGQITLRVKNSLGVDVYTSVATKSSGSEEYDLNLQELPGGVYLLEIGSEDGIAVKRLVKQ